MFDYENRQIPFPKAIYQKIPEKEKSFFLNFVLELEGIHVPVLEPSQHGPMQKISISNVS